MRRISAVVAIMALIIVVTSGCGKKYVGRSVNAGNHPGSSLLLI